MGRTWKRRDQIKKSDKQREKQWRRDRKDKLAIRGQKG